MVERSLPALLVTAPAGVRWLSGFSAPEDARVLIGESDAWLLTDGRYAEQVAAESSIEPVIERDWIDAVAARLNGTRLGVEAEHLTLATAAKLASRTGHEPIRTEGVVTRLRQRKDAAEIAAIRRAAELTDRAFEHGLTVLKPGVRELDVALAIERFVRSEGGDGMAFPIIVASGARSAMPHGTASSKTIEAGELVTIDMGAQVDGYCADMTRTVGIGTVSSQHRALFDAVLEAQRAATAQVRAGAAGRDLDRTARQVLAEHGLAEAFVHSLGHGVGLDVHEGPSLSSRSEDVLDASMTVTIEPGVYLAGDAGVRIEDLVLVGEDGAEVLSRTPTAWRAIETSA